MATLNYKILPTRKKSSGKLGIYLSLTHKKDVRYISTEFEIDDESQWQDGKVCYRKDAAIMNKRMDYVLNEYREKLNRIDVSRYDTCSRLKNELIKVEPEEVSMTLEELFNKRINNLERNGRKCYAEMNKDSMKIILKYMGNPFIEHITRLDIKMLSKKMANNGYTPGGIQIKMAHLKAAINEAIDERWVRYDEHPFTGFKMPTGTPRMMDITVEQFKKIKSYKSEFKQTSFARDLFLLSFYLGGINLTDLLKVDLKGDTLIYSRSKTKDKKTGEKMTIFAIPSEARSIIKKYAPKGKFNWPASEDYDIMLAYSNRCFARLKKELGFEGSFAYYSARKTFAQFAFLLGVKTEVIEYCLGQTMKKNRPIYNYVRVMQRQADAAIRKVIDYTKNPDAFELYEGFE